MQTLYPLYEVGSLPKLRARVEALSSENGASKKGFEQILLFSKIAKIDSEEVIELLQGQSQEKRLLTVDEKLKVRDFNALLNIRLLESLNLNYIYDGEARRVEMYRHCARQIKGFEDYPEMLRSRGPDSWLASICVEEPTLGDELESLPEICEFKFVKKKATQPIKVPLDDPYMIANMTGNRFYAEALGKRFEGQPEEFRYECKKALTLAIAKNVIRPQVKALIEAGAEWIQLDVPSATIDLFHLPIMVEGINAVVEGFETTKFSLHICYPKRVSLMERNGYNLLFPHVFELAPQVNHFSIELANGMQYVEDLKCFAKYYSERKFELGIGVVDITLERQIKEQMETAEEVRDRILLSTEILGDASLIYVAPDCGLRQLSLERAIRLIEVMAKGAELARNA